jgi:outer membrane lipoprotein-sorting protein
MALRVAGGGDRIKSIKDVTVAAKMTMSAGGQSQHLTVKQYTLVPDKHRMDMSMAGMDVKMVVTPEAAYQQMGSQVVDLPPAVAAKMRKEQGQRGAVPTGVLVRAVDPATKVRILPPAEAAGRKVDVIEMIDRDGETTTLWLDAESHLIAKIGDGSGAAELSDWRDVAGGLKYPFKMHISGQQTVDVEAQEVKVNSGLGADLFKR